ncbi:MAG: GntR family transcriptional regulator [Chitinivibrionales bacterium]|nr:GntR family transcriptional regulator [Chitinivibrionales bacterium]
MPKTPYARNRAKAYLTRLIAVHRLRGSRRLPTLVDLARDAGVSELTMHRAVSDLKRAGVLVTSHGKGTTIADDPPASQTCNPPPGPSISPAALTAWKRVRTKLAHDILTNRFGPGEFLPSSKELAERYGVCFHTLRKALLSLVDAGRVEQYRRRYRVPRRRGPGHTGTLVLIARGDSSGSLLVASPRLEEHLRTLERECALAGLRLSVYTYEPVSGRLHDPHGQSIAGPLGGREPLMLGVLIWQIGLEPDSLRDMVARVQLSGLPIAILDESGASFLPSDLAERPQVRCFSIGNDYGAGKRVGRFLLDNGHHCVGFVSPVHASLWSRRRLEGLIATYRACGLADGVRAFVLDHAGQSEFLAALAQRLHQTHQPLHLAGLSSEHLPLSYTSDRTRTEIEHVIEHEAMGAAMTDLLGHAVGHDNITAWVVASDSIALLCLDYLRHRGIPVPSRLSIVGFDDGIDAFLHRITTYNFNGSAAIRAMLAHILDFPRTGRERQPAVVTFDGFVAERSTVVRRASGTLM